MTKILHGIVFVTLCVMMILLVTIVIEDEFAVYDQITIVVSMAWAIANWILMLQPEATGRMAWNKWMLSRGIRRPHLFIAGVGLLILVVIRHALQVNVLFDDYALYDNVTEYLFRYAHTVVVTWFVGWMYVVLSVFPQLDIRHILQTYRLEIISLGILVSVASILRLYQLGLVPNILNGDEGLIGWWAASIFILEGPLSFVFGAIDGVGTTYLYFKSMIFRYFGQNAMTVRLLPALAGIGSVITNYWFARQLFGTRVALITAVMIVFAHTHIHFSRQVAVSYIYATVFMPVYLWGIWQVVATRRTWPAVVTAFALMLHVNFYLDAWAWAVFLVILVIAWAIVDRSAIRDAARPLAFMFGLIVLGLSPMIIWASNFQGEFVSRMSTDGSITTGWLAREAELYDVSQLYIIYTLYEAAILAFFTKPFNDFYHAGVPILDTISAAIFLIGALVVHWQMRHRKMLLLLGWFWGGVTALAVLTVPISTYHYRLFAIVPVVYLIIAYAYDLGLRWIDKQIGVKAGRIILLIMLLMFAINNLHIYQTRFVQVCLYGGDLRTMQAGVVSNYLYELDDPEAVVLIYGNLDEFHYGPWRTMDFMAPRMQFVNATIDTDSRQYLLKDRSVYVVVVPELYFLTKTLSEQYNTTTVVNLMHCGEPILRLMKVNR